MNKILLAVLLLQSFVFSAYADVSFGRKVDGTFMPGKVAPTNYIKNPFCETKTTTPGLISPGTDSSYETGTGLEGHSCDFTAGSVGDKIFWTTNTLGIGGACEAKVTWSGNASHLKAYITNGSGTMLGSATTLSNAANYPNSIGEVTLNYQTCTNGVRVYVEVVSTSANVAKFGVSYGKATNIGTADVKAPTYTTLTSGSGTYTTPAGVTRLEIQMVGGGGGGGGSSTSTANNGGSGGTGGSTTFGTSLLTATGGGGAAGASIGGVGGVGTINSPAKGYSFAGGGGLPGMLVTPSSSYASGGSGASSYFGGAGSGGYPVGAGAAAKSNTGSGGGGGASGPTVDVRSGSGGAAGAYINAVIDTPVGSYSYAVGTGGTGGAAGTSGYVGGGGAEGIIIIKEIYGPQPVVQASQSADLLGTIFYTRKSTCPTNALLLDGGTIPAQYSALIAHLGTSTLDDLRGIFVRGAGTGAAISGITYSGTLGTRQGDQMQGHWHTIDAAMLVGGQTTTATNLGLATGSAYNNVGRLADSSPNNNTNTVTAPRTDGTNGTPRTGTQTHPANISLTPCMWAVSNPVPLIPQSVQYDTTVKADGVNGVTSIDEGTYTPSITNNVNIQLATAYTWQYLRVGKTLTVWGALAIDPTSASTSTGMDFSLPTFVPNNFTTAYQCAGTSSNNGSANERNGRISTVGSSKTVQLRFTAGTYAGVDDQFVHFTCRLQ